MKLSDAPRSRPENFDIKLANLQELKRQDTGLYFEEVTQLQNMAVGASGEGRRQSQYPDWENDDFETLLEELDEGLDTDYNDDLDEDY